ncbi:hypothetical protein BDW22DRAFT_1360547 [Trametopsis cervina]|nr:hypothetical protein BDW22DRAFT_1360547 [Trametopsis cervina]
MAGANYMGGRSNAAKAQINDENGRLQKCHFGKQRLSILTKGLGRLAASLSRGLSMHPTGSSTEHIAAINLAHARRESLAPYTNKNDAGYMRATRPTVYDAHENITPATLHRQCGLPIIPAPPDPRVPRHG